MADGSHSRFTYQNRVRKLNSWFVQVYDLDSWTLLELGNHGHLLGTHDYEFVYWGDYGLVFVINEEF